MDEPKARIVEARRDQVELQVVDLESLLPPEHQARMVWAFVQGLDLGPLYAGIKAVEGHAGRPAGDPKVFMARWLYATLDGVGSARALARLCGEHHAYRWIRGGVEVNDHTRSDFRVAHVKFLDELPTRSVAALMLNGTVTLNPVAQDGVRVRASAGSGSFRRRMATPEAKTTYKQRAATAECVNAQARNRGLRQFLVRGLDKVRAVLLWYALAHNLRRIAHPLTEPVSA
jgi:transposase